MIVGVSRTTSCRNIFRNLKLLTLDSIYIFESASKVHGDRSNYVTNNQIHTHYTRIHNLLRVPGSRLTNEQKTTSNLGVKIYYVLPEFFKSLELIAFKKRLKLLLIEKVFYTVNEFLTYFSSKTS